MLCDHIWQDARLLTLATGTAGCGMVENALVACKDGIIVYAGRAADAPPWLDAETVTRCDGRWITPGLIDCHTHLVYASNRALEFEARSQGASYEEIARGGGGILATVAATRSATTHALLAQSLPRLDALMAEGVTTIEIKSGYGLDLEHEAKQLRVAIKVSHLRRVTVVPTCLAAHAVPPEMAGRPDDYIEYVCQTIIPFLAKEKLATAVDAFAETIGFTNQQVERVFKVAQLAGLQIKLHAEQLSSTGATQLAARYNAVSIEHLEYATADDIAAMAKAGSVAVLLPGAYYVLRETKVPPVALMRQLQVPMAVATDCNPGTSPLTSLLLAMNMAATLFHLTVDECLAGVTRNAAKALGLGHKVGTVEAGKQCDLAIWSIETPADLVFQMGARPLHQRIWRGT